MPPVTSTHPNMRLLAQYTCSQVAKVQHLQLTSSYEAGDVQLSSVHNFCSSLHTCLGALLRDERGITFERGPKIGLHLASKEVCHP